MGPGDQEPARTRPLKHLSEGHSPTLIPAPTSPSLLALSKISMLVNPCRSNASAAEIPPMPPPATAILIDLMASGRGAETVIVACGVSERVWLNSKTSGAEGETRSGAMKGARLRRLVDVVMLRSPGDNEACYWQRTRP